MRIAIDLDNTVFDTAAKYRAVVEAHDGKYTPPVSYDVYKNGYSVAAVSKTVLSKSMAIRIHKSFWHGVL